jgi:predicted phage terminase large subunit-like protein
MLDDPQRREKLLSLARKMAELKRRRVRKEQSQRGWYDDDGVHQGGLVAFVRYFWKVLEPETPFIDGWPLWAMCEHLEAVTAGEITRLVMNVPPGFMKSLLVDVFWPAWEWGPMNMAHLRYVTFSYSASLTERDNERFRDLVISEGYQALYGRHVRPVKIGATKVTNHQKGWKLASSVGGVGTGERGNRVILDDPHNVKEAESETVRDETVRWFRESMSNRLNDLDRDAIIIIMQRVHEGDVSGAIQELGLDYCHLVIPMEYDWTREPTQIEWTDPRDDEGEGAWNDRFPAHVRDRTKKEIGPYAWVGQYQQAPSPRGGGIFQRGWWQLWAPPDDKFPSFEFLLASLDGAFTAKEENDPSALTIWGLFNLDGKRRLMLVHAWRKFLQFSADRSLLEPLPQGARYLWVGDRWRDNPEWLRWRQRTQEHWGLIEWVDDTCTRFKVDRLLIEGKASGLPAADELRNRYGRKDWVIETVDVAKDKVARALAVQASFSQLIVYAPARDWSEMVIDEMAVFPKGKHDDLTDSGTQAVKWLRDRGMLETDEEVHAAELAGVMHKPARKALYQV